VDLRVTVERITADKLVADDVVNKDVLYRVNVTMTETEKNPGWTGIAFALDLTSEPSVARLQVSGTAVIGGTRDEVLPLLSSGNQSPPLVLAKIYERVYGTIYVLCDALQVPHPLPTLMQA
jgi:hypothetical protein